MEEKEQGCSRCSRGRSGVEYLREFSEATTLHGVRYIGERGRHPIERLCWIAAIIVCTALSGFEVAKLYSRWQTSPVIVSFAHRTSHVSTLPMPAVTLCTETRVRRSVVDVEKNLDTLRAQLAGEKPYRSAADQLTAESISLQCFLRSSGYKFLLPSHFVPNKTHLEYLKSVITPQMKDIFVSCWVKGEDVNCSDIFRPIITMYGVCYTFNLLEDQQLFAPNMRVTASSRATTWDIERGYGPRRLQKKISDYPHRAGAHAGHYTGLKVKLKNVPEDLQGMCSNGPAQAVRVLLHLPAQFPQAFNGNFFHVIPGSVTSVAVRPDVVTTSPELRAPRYTPHMRGCNFPEDHSLSLFGTYTQENCEMDCIDNHYRNVCDCQQFFYPKEKDNSMRYCTVNETMYGCGDEFSEVTGLFWEGSHAHPRGSYETGDESTCDCLPGCTHFTYHYQPNTAPYVSATAKESNYSMLAIFFEEPTFHGRHRSELYGVTDFIASCGGLLGLFTGFSVLTAAELVYFATLRLFCCLRARHATRPPPPPPPPPPRLRLHHHLHHEPEVDQHSSAETASTFDTK